MKSFLQGKKSLATSSLRPPVPAAAPHAHALQRPGQPTAAPTSAHVEVVKEGDKVVRLIVTCVCGERVEIDCLYPAGA